MALLPTQPSKTNPQQRKGGDLMLHLKYRPKTWVEFVGNDKAVKQVREVIGRPTYQGGAWWIDGPSGIGKSIVAELIAAELGVDDIAIDEIAGHKCTVDAVDSLREQWHFRPLIGEWRCVIVNEAHAMTSRAVPAWLTLLEPLPPKTVVVFTTTQGRQADMFGDFDDPLLSRCLRVSLTSYGVKHAFAVRAKQVAVAEGLDGQPLAKYERLVQDNRNNLRAVLGAIDMGEMAG